MEVMQPNSPPKSPPKLLSLPIVSARRRPVATDEKSEKKEPRRKRRSGCATLKKCATQTQVLVEPIKLPLNTLQSSKNTVFGVPLSSHVQVQGNSVQFHEHYHQFSEVPELFRCLVEQLQGSLDYEGLFRKCANHQVLTKTIQDIEANPSDIESIVKSLDVNTTADLLKYFLRSLPEPLVHPLIYRELLVAYKVCTEGDRWFIPQQEQAGVGLLFIRSVLCRIPIVNRHVLFSVLRLLVQIKENAHTKMNTKSLSTIFSPLFFGTYETNSHLEFLQENEFRCLLAEFLVEEFSNVTLLASPVEIYEVIKSFPGSEEQRPLLKGEKVTIFAKNSHFVTCVVQDHIEVLPRSFYSAHLQPKNAYFDSTLPIDDHMPNSPEITLMTRRNSFGAQASRFRPNSPLVDI